jgi:hypothetical protein
MRVSVPWARIACAGTIPGNAVPVNKENTRINAARRKRPFFMLLSPSYGTKDCIIHISTP